MEQHDDMGTEAGWPAMPRLLGGNLCLDFANTLDPRGGPNTHDALSSYTALLAWGRHAGILEEDEARTLLRESGRRPRAATAVLEHAVALRETIYHIFSAIAAQQPPAAADLATLERAQHAAGQQTRLVAHGNGYIWRWAEDGHHLDRVLWPVVQAATDLLTSGDVGRVKECPGGLGEPYRCGWLFYDATKNQIRHWCSMESCGNAAKARRQTARRRQVRGTTQERPG